MDYSLLGLMIRRALDERKKAKLAAKRRASMTEDEKYNEANSGMFICMSIFLIFAILVTINDRHRMFCYSFCSYLIILWLLAFFFIRKRWFLLLVLLVWLFFTVFCLAIIIEHDIVF